jgi:hypothetical protein
MKQLIKLLSVIVLLQSMSGCSNGEKNEYFTGEIAYKYSYESSMMNADSLNKERANNGVFRYDTENYQSKFTGKDTLTYYYSGSLNKCLSESGNLHNYECADYDVLTDSILSFKIYDTGEKVLGYSCRILEMQKKNSWVQYYVSNDLKIAPATYQRHRSYNWDVYGKKASGGLILKSEHRFKAFTMKGIAANVTMQGKSFKALQIDEKLFSESCK